ncbi:DUF6515 family protein [Trichloromonas sp.]|uniref:DUF6515 family protein n=1 Tax=Trichloromonas sp. TaxID=3069249 RepID=UPI003D8180EE
MKNRTLIASLLMASLLGTVPGMALADGRGHYKPWKEDRRHHRDYEHVRHGKHEYSYRGGRFYRPGPAGLIAVSAPIGAVVAALPIGFAAVVSGGHTYFHAQGSY